MEEKNEYGLKKGGFGEFIMKEMERYRQDAELRRNTAAMERLAMAIERQSAEPNQASQEQQKRPQEATNGHTPTITPQEQKTAAEPKELKDLLPERLRNDEALKIFQRAIDANLIEKTATGLKWQLSNALLAYLCGIVYCGDTSPWDKFYKEYIVKKSSTLFPDKALSELFGVKNLGQSRLQLIYKPKGYEKVDVLFKG